MLYRNSSMASPAACPPEKDGLFLVAVVVSSDREHQQKYFLQSPGTCCPELPIPVNLTSRNLLPRGPPLLTCALSRVRSVPPSVRWPSPGGARAQLRRTGGVQGRGGSPHSPDRVRSALKEQHRAPVSYLLRDELSRVCACVIPPFVRPFDPQQTRLFLPPPPSKQNPTFISAVCWHSLVLWTRLTYVFHACICVDYR